MRFHAAFVLERLRTATEPMRAKRIWLDICNAHEDLEPSQSGVYAALRRLEKDGKVARQRRYDEDCDELASLWTLQ
jgi:DNA-binding PadR family transcriptional regulator